MPNVTTNYDTSTVTYDQSSLSYDGYPAPLANMPAVGVFIAWTDGPYVASPAWTEVSQYVRAVDIRRGRGDDLQQFPPGGASVTLDNRDRLFDPFNTSGANYANLKPRRQIKIVANWAGVEYPLFRGFIAGWPVEYTEGGLDSTVTIDCFDALGLMANEQVPTNWADYYTRSLSPRHYWKCNDSQTSGRVLDSATSSATLLPMTPTTLGTLAFETGPMAEGLPSTSLNFYNCPMQSVALATSNAVQDFTFAAWVKFQDVSGAIATVVYEYNGIYFYWYWQYATSTYALEIRNATNRTIYTIQQPPQNIAGHWAFVVTANAGGNPSAVIYLNGAVVTPLTTTNNLAGGTSQEKIQVNQIELQEMVVFHAQLTAAQVGTLFAYGVARLSETTSARIQRIIDTTTWPAALEDFTTSPIATVSEINATNGVIPEMQIVTQSEGGELYVTNAGVLKFVNRDNWSSATRSNTSQMTFTDTGTGVDYDAGSVRMAFDADRIRNDINVRFSGGGIVNDTDTTSIATNGAAEWSVGTVLDSPTSAATLADRLVQLYKDPKLRLEPFMAKGQQDATYNWPRLLALELLDRVTFKRTPATGSAVQRDLLVQSIEHRITPGTWETVVNGSTRYTGWFILGVSLLGSSEDVLL